MDGVLLYDDLASWWPLLSSPEDYAEEASFYLATLQESGRPPLRTLLELGSGGGNNASHMKSAFEQVTLVDASPGMLEVSRTLNPECEHVVGDMHSVRLDARFDCVFVHDAICYDTTLELLGQTMETAYMHCRAGGVALFAPDFVRESFRPGTGHGGHDGDGRSLRYLEWTWDPDPEDTTYVADYAFLLRETGGSVQVRHDRHVEGLFRTEEWLETLRRAGFAPKAVSWRHSEASHDSVVFVGVRGS